MGDFYKYIDYAMNVGFTNAVLMENFELDCDPSIRELCNPEQCKNYSGNWVCPPGCGTLEECRDRVKGRSVCILLQSVSDLPNGYDADRLKTLSRNHNLRLGKLIEKVSEEGHSVLSLTSGGCIFCEECRYPKPCVKPDKKMQSLSAHGVDVGRICEKAGLPFFFREDRVYYVACLLI